MATADRLTAFVMAYAASYIRGKGGAFSTVTDQPARARVELENWSLAHCRIGGARLFSRVGEMSLFEGEDILVEFGQLRFRDDARVSLAVEFAKPLSVEAIPPFLREFARKTQDVRGPFGNGKNSPWWSEWSEEKGIPF